jgi:hypothetical protein
MKAALYACVADGFIVLAVFFLPKIISSYLEKRISNELTKKYPSYSLKITAFHATK